MKGFPLILAAAALALLSGTTARADLPNLSKDPWSNYFIGVNDRDILFGITSRAEGIIHPLDRRNDILRLSNPINFDFRVLEQTGGDKVVRKAINYISLKSDQEAVVDPEEPVSFRGKVTGDAAFTVTFAHDRDGYHFTGSITDKGSLEKPLKFGIDFSFDPYRGVDMSSDADLKKFKKMARRDRLEIVTLKGEKVKLDIDEEVDLKEKFPDGVTSVALKTVRYDGTDFKLTASKGSKIFFEEEGEQPVYKALKVLWTMNTGADPTKEKLTLVAD